MTEFPDNDWYAVAGSAALRPGDVMPVHLLGAEYVAWRGEDGASHVWQNRCIHRGMRLQYGFVDGDRLACRYHGWRFGAEGNCQYIPAHPDMTPPDDYCVPAQPSTESGRLIWATSGDPGSPAPDLSSFSNLVYCRSTAINAPPETVAEMLNDEPDATVVAPAVVSLAGNADAADTIVVAVQPVSDEKTQIHVLGVSPDASSDQTDLRLEISAWTRQFRQRAEHRFTERRTA